MALQILKDGKSLATFLPLWSPFRSASCAVHQRLFAMGLIGADVAQAQEGPLIYVPNLGGNDVSVIDTPTNTVAPTATVFSGPLAAAVRSDQSLVYFTNIGDNTVSVVDTASNTVIATVQWQWPYTHRAQPR